MGAFPVVVVLVLAEVGSQGTVGVAVEGAGRDAVAAAVEAESWEVVVLARAAAVVAAAPEPAGRSSHQQDPSVAVLGR